MQQTLRNLIATGKVKQAITELNSLTVDDADLKNRVIQLSARYTSYERQYFGGLEDSSVLSIELNKINNSLLAIIDELGSSEGVHSNLPTQKNRADWLKIDNAKFIVALLASVVVIMIFIFKYGCGSGGNNGKPFNVVVFTHGSKGKQDIVKLEDTKLIIDFKGDRRISEVGKEGQNNFNEVPANFWGRELTIGLQGKNYELVKPNEIYKVSDEPIYVEIKSNCSSCTVEGIVQTYTSFIPNAVASIGSQTATTDSNGYFKIIVPPNKEDKEYAVTITLNGKIVSQKYVTPNPKQPAEFLIENK
jgi:hypothetical protein